MISPEDARRLFRLALDRFASPWEIAVDLTEVTVRDPNHWLSGVGTFGATLRDPATGALKVLGRRWGAEEGATFHRGLSGLVLQAYLEGTSEPIRRYLEEIGVIERRSSAGAIERRARSQRDRGVWGAMSGSPMSRGSDRG